MGIVKASSRVGQPLQRALVGLPARGSDAPVPPNWWIYRTVCILMPAAFLTLIGIVVACVIYQEGNTHMGNVIGFSVFGISCVVFVAITAIGIAGRPIFLMPKLIRDAHAAGAAVEKEAFASPSEVGDSPDGEPVFDAGLDVSSGLHAAPDDADRFNTRPRQRRQRRPRQRSRKGRA